MAEEKQKTWKFDAPFSVIVEQHCPLNLFGELAIQGFIACSRGVISRHPIGLRIFIEGKEFILPYDEVRMVRKGVVGAGDVVWRRGG